MRVEGGLNFAVFRRQYKGVSIYGVTNRHADFEDLHEPLRETQNLESETVFRWVLSQEKPDIVHFHNLIGLSGSLLQVAQMLDIPHVVSLHNYWFLCPRHDLLDRHGRICPGPDDAKKCAECIPPNGDARKLEDRSLEYVARLRNLMEWLNKADKVIAVSDFVRRLFVENGLDSDRVVTLGAAASSAEQLHIQRKNRVKKPEYPLTFGYLGAISRRKAPHLLLDAAEMVHDLRDKFRIVLHGAIMDDEYADTLRRRISEDNRFLPPTEFAGYYKPEMLYHILSKFDVCVTPSIWHETAPRTVMESLGAGVPVIAPVIGGIPEIIGHGYNGLLFEAGDAGDLAAQMRFIIEQPSVLVSMQWNIPAPRSVLKHAEHVLSVYHSVLESKPKAKVPARAAARQAA